MNIKIGSWGLLIALIVVPMSDFFIFGTPYAFQVTINETKIGYPIKK